MFAANLKNSVTRVVEPLRVIAWRVGACLTCLVGAIGEVYRAMWEKQVESM